jgi:hypothetical protein
MQTNDETQTREPVACYGSAVKALGNGKVGGYLVLFSGPADPDLQGDYFTKDTDFFLDSGERRPILYRHGAHPIIKSQKLGKGTVTIDDIGVFIEGELELRDKYEKAIYALIEKGKLGWSSGSMSHLVARLPHEKSFEITSWPIGEASLTPQPVEGRTSAFSLKDMAADEIDLDAFIKSMEEPEVEIPPFEIAGTPALKAFCDDLAPSSLKDASQRSEAAALAVKEFCTIGNILGEAFHAYTSRLVRRSQTRFLKDNRTIDAATVTQVTNLLTGLEQVEPAYAAIKEALLGIKKISDLSKAEQKAMDEKARFALWNYYRISGFKPKELDDGSSTG